MNIYTIFQDRLALSLSCIIHLLFLGPAIYIVFLCAQLEYSLLIWHPACFTIGCCLLMTEAILGVSGEALLVSKVSRKNRIRIHWILHVVGMGLLAIGLGTVLAYTYGSNGTENAKPRGIHGKVGRIGIVISVLVTLGGFLYLCIGTHSEKISLDVFKLLHSCSGMISVILLLFSQVTGLYTSWWPGSDIGRILTVVAYAIGGFLLLVKPLHNTILRVRGVPKT